MLEWTDSLADGALSFRKTDPRDTDLDHLDCGSTPDAQEVTAYFRNRTWFKHETERASPPVFSFGQGAVVIGYAAIAFANKPHPTECDVNRARYLVVYVVGIDERFHGVVNAASPTGERYAESVFRALEEVFARQKADCVGLYLMVRSSNARAIGFYKRIGFAVDAGVAAPAASATTDAATVVMRKLLP